MRRKILAPKLVKEEHEMTSPSELAPGDETRIEGLHAPRDVQDEVSPAESEETKKGWRTDILPGGIVIHRTDADFNETEKANRLARQKAQKENWRKRCTNFAPKTDAQRRAHEKINKVFQGACLLYTSPSPRD